VNFLIVQLPTFSRHLVIIRSKYSSQNPVLKSLSLCSSVNVRDQVSHPYNTTVRIMVLYILTFTFWTAGGMTKDSQPNGTKHSPNFVCS
jgi:hypothetical protein